MIEHPFIIHCFGGFESQACIGLVFEFAYGGELYHYMKKRMKFTENEAKFYICELCSVLHYLHDTMMVVYRDLKPEVLS